jgi:hypothetical protein
VSLLLNSQMLPPIKRTANTREIIKVFGFIWDNYTVKFKN